jgi:hypothetical protein
MQPMKTFLIVAMSLLLPCLAAQAPAVSDSLLDHMAGNWVLQGVIARQQTTHDITAEWALGHQYLRFHEVSREKNAKGQPLYEADVYITWREAAKEYVCVWLDSTGLQDISQFALGHAPRKENEIHFLFKTKDDVFHTVFTYDNKADTWDWRMDSEQNGTMKPFARVKLVRK